MEDNELSQLMIKRTLSSFGVGQILIASNGEDGTKMAELYKPSFILLDMQMPGKHGDELLTQLRLSQTTKCTPIIAITATPLDKMRTLQRKHNLCAVLPKPFPDTDLFNSLAAC
jgi:CheY-like chemotaxis protein